MRVALLAAGQTAKAKNVDAETMWRDAETRNEGARTDSILKQYQAGLLPDDFALGELGYSQHQIERIQGLRNAPTPQRIEAATALVRAGFDPQAALSTVGLDPVKHLGLLPITVKDAQQIPATNPDPLAEVSSRLAALEQRPRVRRVIRNANDQIDSIVEE